ncbi:MAG: crossover junction endodeoxyribonuclease RuvC [FCB group bacterium]|nr:crossover junction endodeoxyribonuclease RuvC [FCB group bacterium]
MRVLGFDPGTATTGYGVVDITGNKLQHVAHGTILTTPDETFPERLRAIHTEAWRLIDLYKPHYVSIEKIYVGRNVTTAVTVLQARGVITLAAAQHGRPVAEFAASEVKNSVVGYGKATKRQVQEMIKLILNLDDLPRPDDAADALALAICQAHANRAPVSRVLTPVKR